MKDKKEYAIAEDHGYTLRGRLSELIEERRAHPSLILRDLSLVLLGFLFARCHLLFGARPLATGLLALLPSGIFTALIGTVAGALSLGASGTAYAIIYTLIVALRIIISGAMGGDGAAFGESLLIRICESTIGGFIIAVYQLLLSDFGAASLLFGLVMTLVPPIVCFALSGIFDTGIGFSDVFGGDRSLLSFEGLSEREKYALIFFHLSTSLLSLLIALSLAELELFGFSFAYVYVGAVTLFTAHRFGAVRGAAIGFASTLALSATNSAAFALAGAASGILFSFGGFWGVGAGALVLIAWSAYTGGAMGILTTLPEYAVSGAIMLPFVNKTLQNARRNDTQAPVSNTEEMVLAMTLAYRNRPSRPLDSLEEALVGISAAADNFEFGGGVREEEYRDMVVASARALSGADCEAAREICIEKAAVIAARLKSGSGFSASMLGLGGLGRSADELCELISRRAAAMQEERYKQSLTAGKHEDYRLISKLLNEARSDCDRERALDSELCDRLSLLFAECGFPSGIIKVFGSRHKHVIAAGDDPDGSLITSPELRAGLERLLDVRLGEAEYFRRDRTVLMEVSAERKLSATSAVATIQGSSGEVSGDVSSAFTSEDDYFFSLLSDGMGSGELARETASFAIRFLTYALASGGFRDTVLQLLNNLIRRRGEECSATVDLFSLDLICGDALFIKSGAAPSYVKRDSSIFRIRSESAPIGLMAGVDAERVRVEVKPGDYVIMLSDGVSSTPEDAPWLLELISEPPKRSVKEYAEYILSEAVKNSTSGDDMTVLVTKISDAAKA